MVLHLLVSILSVSVLAGMYFTYNIPNDKNEVVLLVDVSETQMINAEKRDDYVERLLEFGRQDNFKMAVVTFGFDQQLAVPLTNKLGNAFEKYLDADLPDTSATNIAGALSYAKDLFTNYETSKIILISDGKETDDSAAVAISSVTSLGIKVDTINVNTINEEPDVQVVDIAVPNENIMINTEYLIKVTLESNSSITGTLSLFDNGEENVEALQEVRLSQGTNVIDMKHTFTTKELHELNVVLNLDDELEDNNSCFANVLIELRDKILILESQDDSSKVMTEWLNAEEYKTDVVNLYSAESIPSTIDQLLNYDQIILNNIANADMDKVKNPNVPEGFVDILYDYVYKYGGSMFTTGGNDQTGEQHAYDWQDMPGSKYQEMLPVSAVKYTPPVAIVFAVDISGSMSEDLMYYIKAGIRSVYGELSDRDQVAIVNFNDSYGAYLPLTPVPNRSKIINAVESLPNKGSGSTAAITGISKAADVLKTAQDAAKRHIIVVTDGYLQGGQESNGLLDYQNLAGINYKDYGITMSIVAFNMKATDTSAANLKTATDMGGGKLHCTTEDKIIELPVLMREDISASEINKVNMEPFAPTVYDITKEKYLDGVVYGPGEGATAETKPKQMHVKLGGFYGVKVKSSDYLVLVGDYLEPIYAEWQLGKGKVGSFMCDINGTWSTDFLGDESGKNFLNNVVKNLMPSENIRPKTIKVSLTEDNYINSLSIPSELKKGESIQATIYKDGVEQGISLNQKTNKLPEDAFCTVENPLTADNGYSRATFIVKDSGTYKLVFNKMSAEGNLLETVELYKTFSYSEEYQHSALLEAQATELLQALAKKANGLYITEDDDINAVFDSFIIHLDRSYDPRILFMILAIILFLLDITVRKFKFKWPHEIIRNYREKKADEKNNQSR